MEDDMIVWLGTQSSAIAYFEQHARGYRMAETDPGIVQAYSGPRDEQESRFNGYDDLIQVVNNVAIVPIQGSMMAKESWMTRFFGVMTYDTISNIMASVVEDGAIDTVLFDIDSPGGQAKGIDTARDGIQAAKDAGIAIAAHTAGSMSSAAYWIGSEADFVGATEAAEVGSVGVIAVHAEHSERNKKEGDTFTVLRKGENKALATPFEKLSEKGRAQIEASMDRSYQQFVSAVSENRGIPKDYVLDKIATGDVFGAQQALELGMIDEVIAYNDLVSRYVKAETPAQHGAGNTAWSEAAMHKQPIVNAGDLSPEEAAIAVAAGADPDQLAPKVDATDEDESQELAEVTVVDESADSGGEAGEATPAAESGEEDNTAAAADQSVLQNMISSLNDQLVEAKMEAKTLADKVTALQAGNTGLRQIAVEQTQRLRVSLGMPNDISDLELMSDAALVTAHTQTLSQFMTRFNIGATSRVSDEDNTNVENVTRLHAAVKKATSI